MALPMNPLSPASPTLPVVKAENFNRWWKQSAFT